MSDSARVVPRSVAARSGNAVIPGNSQTAVSHIVYRLAAQRRYRSIL